MMLNGPISTIYAWAWLLAIVVSLVVGGKPW